MMKHVQVIICRLLLNKHNEHFARPWHAIIECKLAISDEIFIARLEQGCCSTDLQFLISRILKTRKR
jgi:hypothetical protein